MKKLYLIIVLLQVSIILFSQNSHKNSNELIWLQDSVYDYYGNGTDWNIDVRYKVLSRNESGKVNNAIRHFWDETNGQWLRKDTIFASYYGTGISDTYIEKPWDDNLQGWTDTIKFIKQDEEGNEIINIEKNWDYENNEFTSGDKMINIFNSENNLISETFKYFDITTNLWIKESLTLYEYDSDGNNIKVTEKEWNSVINEWENTSQTTYEYDSDNNEIQLTHQNWDAATNEWVYSIQYLYEYDSEGNKTQIICKTWNNGSDSWENVYKNSYTFDSSGNNIELLVQHWDSSSNSWSDYSLTTNTYDVNNNQTEYLFKLWDNGTGSWVNYSMVTYSYVDENLTQIVSQTWNTNLWENVAKVMYSYDISGNRTEEKRQIWNNSSSSWINNLLNTYDYDANNNKIKDNRQLWDNTSETWENQWQYLFEFDADNNETKYLYQTWNSGTNEWVNNWRHDYFWSETDVVSISNIDNSIVIFPNPANEIIRISGINKIEWVKIFSISGKLVNSKGINMNNEIDVKKLSKGVYILSVNLSDKIINRVFVKE